MTHKRLDPALLAELLDRDFGVLARSGLHCAPEAHRILGTDAIGALRLSVGWCSTEEDVEQAIEAVEVVTRQVTVPVS